MRLLAMTQAYVFEKSLCEKCVHLSRVARAIDSGSVHTDHGNPYHKVEYLIFELADHDIRAHLDTMDVLDLVFMMKFAEHVTEWILSDLHQIVAELCEPDPSRRGLPRNSKGYQYSLERYISKFDHLAYQAQGKLK